MVVTARNAVRQHRWFTGLTLVNLLLVLLLVAAELFIAERHWLTTLLTYMPQQLFVIPTAVLLMISLLGRRWKFAGWNGAAALLCLFPLLNVNILSPAQQPGRRCG